MKTIAERRRHPRQETASLVVLVSHGQADCPPGGEVILTNVSSQGVGFRCHFQPPVGSRYRLRVDDGPLDEARTVRIVTCLAQGGDYLVGAEYC
jgi:hypothetical protein